MPGRTALPSAAVVVALVAGCMAASVVASMKPAEAAFPGDNGSIIFAGSKEVVGEPGAVYHEGLFRMGPDGGGVKRLVEGAYVASPEYSADGSKLVWSENTCPGEGYFCNTLFVANADGTGRHALPNIPGGRNAYDASPSWYPSGRKIVFSANPTGGEDMSKTALFVVPVDKNGYATGPPTQWTDPNRREFIDRGAVVSPDGSKIAFAGDRRNATNSGGNWDICVMDANKPEGPNNPVVRLTDSAIIDRYPNWSPDGKKIVYESRKGNRDWDIVVMNADGTSKKNLTEDVPGYHQYSPAFSPNGRWIVYSSASESHGGFKIWKMRTDGTGKVLLNDHDGPLWGAVPNWRPRP